MLTAPRVLICIRDGLAAALIIAIAHSSPAAANPAGVDPVVTGAIGSGAVSDARPLGSLDFRRALQLLDTGDAVGAYDLARGLSSDVERRAVQWAAITYGNGKIAYDRVLAFSADAPAFATATTLKTRLEQALVDANAPNADIIKYLGGAMPATLDAQIALALAYVADGQRERGARIARDIWVNNFLDPETETLVYKKLGNLLTPADNWARAEHLMMNDRATAVERIMPLLTTAQQSLAVARNAVSRNASNAKSLLDAVDPAYKTNPIYYYSRAQRARQFELWDDAIAYLDKGKPTDPDAEEWWYERRALIRQLLSNNDAARAYRAAANYTDGPEGRLVEARFHAGWIALSFLKDAASAERHFVAMAGLSTLPDSVSQAQYWLGRSREAMSNKTGAAEAYSAAAKYGTIYYGLLARAKLGLQPVELRDLPPWQDSQALFDSRETIRAVRLLSANGEKVMAAALLRSVAQNLKTGGELLLAARLAQTIDAHYLAISIADIADKRGTPLDLFSFPKDGLPATQLAEIDKAAIYAVTRQESRFQIDAVSSSGARGLMQLMPETARETAQRVGVAYSQSRLTTDASYNALLGSTYLATQLASYDNSLLLAAAAYNAGAGNANKWIKAYGDPRQSNVDPVVWVELIPFQETRKYVQRVLGNYLVYRARLGLEELTPAQALRRIPG